MPESQKLPGIFMATPAYRAQVHLAYMAGVHGVARAAKDQGIELIIWQQGGESHINRARNYAVADFLKSTASYLFFIDADIGFTVDDFQKVISMAFHEGLDVVAGAYPIKEINWERAAQAIAKGENPHSQSSRIVVHRLDVEDTKGYVEGIGDCIEVKECGTGFMCISRKCIESMIAAHPETAYTDDRTDAQGNSRTLHNLFHADIKDDVFNGKPIKRWLSEDYWFCRTWRDMGGKIWLHLGVNLGHYGDYEHRGNPHEVHGGPQRGLKALPSDKDRIMATLTGSMAPSASDTAPPLIVDHEAREGAFAIWAGLRFPNVIFDLYEPDPVLRSFLKENFAVYGLHGQVHDTLPTCNYSKPHWKVNSGKVEVVT